MTKPRKSNPPVTKDGLEPLQPFPVADIPRDPESLAKLGARALQGMEEFNQLLAEHKAKEAVENAAARKESKERKRALPRQEVEAVHGRLRDVIRVLMAIHRFSVEAIDGDLNEREDLLLLIHESARSAARAVDVCMQRLGADYPVGCFPDELDDS